MEIRNQKSVLYNYIKIITTILVVIGHVTVMYTNNGAIKVGGQSLLLQYITEIIYSFHIPLFYAVTGAVFALCIESGKYKDSVKYILNKCKKLLIPYFAFGIFYVAPVMKAVGLIDGSFTRYIWEGIFLSRNSRHLWFLGSILCMYILYLPFKELLRNKIYIGLVLMGAVSFFLYQIAYEMPQDFQIRRACLDQGWFYAGVLFNAFYDKIGLLWSGRLEKSGEWFDKIGKIPFVKTMERNSFGIYLIHPMIIYLLFYWFGYSPLPPVVLCGCIFLVTMAVSIGVTEGLRKMKLGILLGE